MAKTAAERAKVYRDKQKQHLDKVIVHTEPVTPELRDAVQAKRDGTSQGNVTQERDERHENVTVSERDASSVTIGPLDVYSEQRWARLEKLGYKWQGSVGIKYPDIMAVPVPGDPAYQRGLS